MHAALRVSATLLALTAGGCLAGCGGSSSDRPALPPGVLSRHDAAPDGVAATVRATAQPAIAGICAGSGHDGATAGSATAITLDRRAAPDSAPDHPRLGETLLICPAQFDENRPVSLTIRRSDGSETSKRLVPRSRLVSSDVGYFGAFFLDASSPLGRAVATASQDGRSAQATFVVGAPHGRGVRVEQWFGRPPLPNPVPVMAVGAPPRSSVPVDVYAPRAGGDQRRLRYVTTLHVKTDERGIGEVRVPYARADNGAYELRARRASGRPSAEPPTHLAICVACCESDADESGSEYCAN